MLKKLIKGVMRKLGYDLRRIGSNESPPPKSDPDSIAALTVKEAAYYSIWSPPYPLYTPWVGHPDFMVYYHDVAKHTYVSADRCYMILNFARHALLLDGDLAECGVCRGGTALLLARLLPATAPERHLFLFDSFEGLPRPDLDHDNYYKAGDFSFEDVESIKEMLSFFANFSMKKGWIPATFQGLEQKRFSFVHVDVDLYQPTIDICNFFYPRLVPGGVMLFDDYGFPSCRGEKDAADEFFADKAERPFVLSTGQGILIKA